VVSRRRQVFIGDCLLLKTVQEIREELSWSLGLGFTDASFVDDF